MRSRFQHGLWRLHSFRVLMSASMVSIFGSLITSTAFPYIAIHELNAGPAEIALLSLAGIVPTALLGSIAGVWVDRLSRRRTMIACDLISASTLVVIPIAYWVDQLSLILLLLVTAVTNLARLGFRIADRSFLPTVVGREKLEEANATLSGGSAIAEAAGFSVGGLLVQMLSGPLALGIDAVSFVGSALLLKQLPEVASDPETDPEVESTSRHWRADMSEAFRFLRASSVLSPLALSGLLMAVGMQITGTVYFLFVNETVGFSPGALGFIFATGGIGSLIGAALQTRATARFGAGIAVIGSLILLGLSWGSITLASSVGAFALALLLGQQMGDGFWLYYETTSTTIRQLHAPEAMLGRINGAFENIEFGGLLLGAGVGALIGEQIGYRAAILTGGALVIIAAIPILLSPIRGIGGLTESSATS